MTAPNPSAPFFSLSASGVGGAGRGGVVRFRFPLSVFSFASFALFCGQRLGLVGSAFRVPPAFVSLHRGKPCSSVVKILVRGFGVFRGFPAAGFSAPFLRISGFQFFSVCFCVSAFRFLISDFAGAVEVFL
jgi:hypothetical protein